MRVSVVVPVCNPGRWIEDLLASLRAQTLDPAELEVLFVDDGSDDGTPERLEAAALETPSFRLIRTPRSGWPGRPRNIGIDAARGDYVFLSDHDDHLHPEALERLTDFAREHASDVVIGKVVGVGRSAPDRIFARTLVDAQEDPGLLMTSLTPQKLYRRAFLNEQRIRFPEGERRLEDHLFVTKAYLRAARVSVYADVPIYYFVLRDDGENASRRPIEWAGYFANAAESVAVVDAEAPDEATRVLMRQRWLRTEAIGRLRGRRFLGRHDRDGLLTSAALLVQRHYPAAEVDRLPTADRLIGRLLLDGRLDDVVAFAEWEASFATRTAVDRARVDRAARRLVVQVRAEVRATTPLPARLDRLPDGVVREDVDALAALPRGARLTAALHRAGGAVVDAAVEQLQVVEGVLTAVVVVPLDRTPPIDAGAWRLRTTVRGPGRPVTASPTAGDVERRLVRIRGARFAVGVDPQRRLVLEVARAGALGGARRAAGRLRRAAGRLPRR